MYRERPLAASSLPPSWMGGGGGEAPKLSPTPALIFKMQALPLGHSPSHCLHHYLRAHRTRTTQMFNAGVEISKTVSLKLNLSGCDGQTFTQNNGAKGDSCASLLTWGGGGGGCPSADLQRRFLPRTSGWNRLELRLTPPPTNAGPLWADHSADDVRIQRSIRTLARSESIY